MTDEELAVLNESIRELGELTGDFESRLLAVGDFVVRHGGLGDLYDEPDLTMVQMMHPATTALGVLGHWSVARGDGNDKAPLGYADHKTLCSICPFLEQVVDLVDEFPDDGHCELCRHLIEWHELGRDHNSGDPYIVCCSGWERLDTHAAPVEVNPDQVGDAYETRWFALLTDGRFGVVIRTYYIVEDDRVIECLRNDEYLVCSDPYQPGATEIASNEIVTTVDSHDPAEEDTRSLAVTSFEPTTEEWAKHAPGGARDLLIPEDYG